MGHSSKRRSDKLLSLLALTLSFALPAAFYVFGDLTDQFPGFLTLKSNQSESRKGPAALGEKYPTVSPTQLAVPFAEADGKEFYDQLLPKLEDVNAKSLAHGQYAVAITDVASGEKVFDHDAETARTPASTLKLLTAISALATYPAQTTLKTEVVLSGDEIVLKGGGDMLLSAGAPSKDVNGRASLAVLADRTRDLLQKAGKNEVSLGLDDTLFKPQYVNPNFGENGPAQGWVAPTMALAVNRGDAGGGVYGPKQADPALEAGKIFAKLLTERGIKVKADPVRKVAPEGGERVAVESASIRELVQHTLLHSDNTTAEVLGRLVALARHETPNAEGAAKAVTAEVNSLRQHYQLPEMQFSLADTSGLSVSSKVPPILFTQLLAAIAHDEDSSLKDLFPLLPVSHYSGTLATRFGEPGATSADGLVRAKTGYLDGTTTLAGVTTAKNGRLVAFSIVVYGFQAPVALEAKATVDRLAAQITG